MVPFSSRGQLRAGNQIGTPILIGWDVKKTRNLCYYFYNTISLQRSLNEFARYSRHADFTKDIYRILTAVDSVLIVIDAIKGIESRTIKLMEICRIRNTPIMTFLNKID